MSTVKVYNVWARGKVNHVMCAPGVDHPETEEFFENTVVLGQVRKKPKTFVIPFVEGVAHVEPQIARYLIAKGHAFRKPQREISGVHPDGRPPIAYAPPAR